MLLNLGGIAPGLAAPKAATKLAGKISEVSPPDVIQQLKPLLDKYQPQVSISSPRQNEVLDDNTVPVKFNVKDLPIYKDEKLGLGSHLHVFLDDQPYQAIYDVSQPVVFKDLAAGTHTIRAFAGRPWHESFKNDGAFAQVTFHVFTKTPNNNPNPKLPLLTYNRPQASYGAEPILLDFYLTNAPLHIVAQEDDKDEVADWRVKVTANGDSFTLDRWQSIYLKGFKPGKNWVQLEYVDEKGNPVQNVYNNTARVFNYEPNGQDSLSKLTRGEISFDQAVPIVDRNYKPAPKPEKVAPTPEPIPVVEEKSAEQEVKETPIEEAPKPAEAPKPQGGFFNRFKRSEPKSIVTPTPESSPEPEVAPTPEPEKAKRGETGEPLSEPEKPEAPANAERGASNVAPEAPAAKPQGGFFNRFQRSTPTIPPVVVPSPEPVPDAVTEAEETQQPEVITPVTPEAPAAKAAPGGFFNRFKRPNVAPVVPAPIKAPSIEQPTPIEEPEAEKAPEQIEIKPAPEVKEVPKTNFFDRFKRPEAKFTPAPEAVEEVPTDGEQQIVPPEPAEIVPIPEVQEVPKTNFFDRFKRPEAKPSIVLPSPTPIPDDLSAPEVETPEPVEIEPAEPIEIKPAPEVKAAPKANFFDRFKRPEAKPSVVLPTPIPDDLSVPAVETPESVKPQSAEPEATPLVADEPSSERTPEAAPSDFEPQTELERRLGMPLKPRISQPVTSPEPALPSESAE